MPLTSSSQQLDNWEELLKKNSALARHCKPLLDAGMTKEIVKRYSEDDLVVSLIDILSWKEPSAKIISKKLKLLANE